jgi:hypothetical protein
MAAEFAEAVPVIIGAGPMAGVAARIFADALRLLAGAPAISLTLPDGMPTALAMLANQEDGGASDFYRDRVDEPAERIARLLVIGDDREPEDPMLGSRSAAQVQLDDMAARRAAEALHELAMRAGNRSSSVELPAGEPLSRFGAAASFGMFTAAYLALGLGIDPSAPRPGELAR